MFLVLRILQLIFHQRPGCKLSVIIFLLLWFCEQPATARDGFLSSHNPPRVINPWRVVISVLASYILSYSPADFVDERRFWFDLFHHRFIDHHACCYGSHDDDEPAVLLIGDFLDDGYAHHSTYGYEREADQV